MGKRIESSARVFLSRAYNYIDTCAFQGQWKEHVTPLLQWRNMSVLLGMYVLKI